MVAVSKIGRQDRNMVDMETGYYEEAIAHFLPYDKHPAIQKLNEYITEVFGRGTYQYYFNFRMNSYAYTFEKDAIKNSGIYEFVLGPPDYFAEILPLIQDF